MATKKVTPKKPTAKKGTSKSAEAQTRVTKRLNARVAKKVTKRAQA